MAGRRAGLVYAAPEVGGDRRAYGIWANLYSVRSRRGLGIGNVSDLAKLARFAGEHGADFVGLNPLHALRNRETEISPYGPVSRLFRNPLYLDVTRVPELTACDEARARMSADGFARELERARMAERIDYERAARLQRPVLEALWRAFRSGTTVARSKAVERYHNRMGATLRDKEVNLLYGGGTVGVDKKNVLPLCRQHAFPDSRPFAGINGEV